MLIWTTGVSGSGRTEYLREMAALCTAPHSAEVVHVADLLRDLPSNLRVLGEQQMTRLLDSSDALRKLYVRGALFELKNKLDTVQANVICAVSTHACFLRDGRLRPGMEMALLKQHFAPRIDMFATVIDSCDEVWGRLHQRPEWQDQLELVDIAVWRDIEITMTRMLAEYEAKPFFLLTRRDGPESLYRICTNPDAQRIYLSYPISNILREKKELFDQAQALAERLRTEGFVVFNPISIQDVPATRALLVGGSGVEVPHDQVKPAKRYLDSQTMSRDFQLIDQADMVVAFYPSTDVSTGVMAELNHARDTDKPRYSCRYEGRRSPFDKFIFGEMLPDEDSLVTRLNELYKDADGNWTPRSHSTNKEERP